MTLNEVFMSNECCCEELETEAAKEITECGRGV